MRHLVPTLAVALLAGCTATATGTVTPGASASPKASTVPGASSSPSATGASAAPAASAAPSAMPSGVVATVVPGTSVAVPITYKLTVDGSPGELEPAASFHNAPGSPGSIFWDIGAYAKTPGSAPTGALKAGQFACVIHCAAAAADPNFFTKVRTLTEAEFKQAIKFTLREGVTVPQVAVPIAREWYVDGRTANANLTGSLTRVGMTVTFKIAAVMPEDKFNGKPHTIDLEVEGLPVGWF